MPLLTRKPLSNLSKVSTEMGMRGVHPYSGKTSTPHEGIDLVPDGSLEVYAAHDGTVTFSGQQILKDKITKKPILDENGNTQLVGYGNYIKVTSHDGTLETLYAHLSERLVEVGQDIGKGTREVTQIGVAGNTGGSTGVHLHFEIRLNGVLVNPRKYLSEVGFEFRDEFSTTVQAQELTGELEGDTRDNTFIGNIYPNSFIGYEGEDTYYIPSLNNVDQIIDSDKDGRIIIGQGKSSVILQGDALPKKNPDGSFVYGQWSLNGYDLIRYGETLIVIPEGTDADIVTKPRIIINDFDFDSIEPKFGINLGKIKENLGATVKLSDAEAFSGNVFTNSNKQGRFFAPVMIPVGDTQDYGVRTYDSDGFPLNTLTLTSNRNSIAEDGSGTVQALYTGGQSVQLENGNIAFVYAVNEINYGSGSTFLHGKSTAHLAVMDSKGALVCNDKIDEAVSTDWTSYNSNLMNPSFVNTHSGTGRNTLGFVRGGNRYFCGEFALDGTMSASL